MPLVPRGINIFHNHLKLAYSDMYHCRPSVPIHATPKKVIMPHFSPNVVVFTPAIKKSTTTLPQSPLSRMSINTETELLGDGTDEVGTPDSSSPLSNDDVDELYDCNDPASSSKFTKEDLAFSKAFMSMDLDDLDKLEASMNTTLGELFSVAREAYESAIYIKDKDYEFNVDIEIIEIIESNKFYGKDEEFPYEHLERLTELADLFGKTEIEKHYYFLKLFPFSLGGEAKAWFNSLAPKSITSKEACF